VFDHPQPKAIIISRMDEENATLQVLIANERDDRLDLIDATVVALGHEVIARSTTLKDLGQLSRRVHADVALIGIGLDGEHALEMISAVVQEAACPVVALLEADDPAMITEAAKRGVFAYVILNGRPEDLENALDITLRRFREFMSLQGAFGRRAIIEQAKGILMARNGIDADAAYQLLKQQSQATHRKLFDIAESVTQSYLLMKPAPAEH